MPFTMVHGNGGLLTTVGDMLIWNAALDQGTIPGGADAVRTLETRARLTDGTEISYALGLTVGALRGVRQVTHGGATAGYRTYLARWPDKKLSVAVFCNAANVNPTRFAERIAIRLLGLSESEAAPGSTQAIAGAELEPLAGVYRDSLTDNFLTFALRDGKLTVSGGGPSATLTHLGNRHFWSDVAGDFQFNRNGTSWQVVQTGEGRRRFESLGTFDTSQVRSVDYVGRYRSPELDTTVEIKVEDGALVLKQRPATRIVLTPIYPDGFRGQGTIRFVRQGDKVTGLRIFAGRARDVRYDKIE